MRKPPQRPSRIKTGVGTLDTLVDGGLPKGTMTTMTVLADAPGAGMTTLAQLRPGQAERAQATWPTGSAGEATTRAGWPRAERRGPGFSGRQLQSMHEIAALLAEETGVESLLPRLSHSLARVSRLQAVAVACPAGQRSRLVCWSRDDAPAGIARRARSSAELASRYFARSPPDAGLLRNVRRMGAVTLPLLVANADPLGAISFAFGAKADESLLAFLGSVTHQLSVALDRFRRLAEVVESQKRLQFLADVGTLLSSNLDVSQTLTKVAHAFVELRRGFCAIDLIASSGTVRVASAVTDDVPAAVRRQILALVPDVAGAANAQLARLGFRSAQSHPIQARGRQLGLLLVASRQRWEIDLSDAILAEDLATRIGMAVDSSELYQEARHALANQQALLSTVSHDLGGLGFALRLTSSRLLKRWGLEPDVVVVDQLAQVMTALIGDLAEHDRLAGERLKISPQPHRLDVLALQALGVHRAMAARKRIRLQSRVESRPVVQCDKVRLFQVVSNLLSNALKFTPEGGRVTLSISSTKA